MQKRGKEVEMRGSDFNGSFCKALSNKRENEIGKNKSKRNTITQLASLPSMYKPLWVNRVIAMGSVSGVWMHGVTTYVLHTCYYLLYYYH
jgi:hypothetical protein